MQNLAEAAGLGTASIKRFEAGQVVHANTVQAIAATISDAGLVLLNAGEPSAGGGEGVRRARGC